MPATGSRFIARLGPISDLSVVKIGRAWQSCKIHINLRLEKSAAETIVMPNGCLCCRVRGDLVEALRHGKDE